MRDTDLVDFLAVRVGTRTSMVAHALAKIAASADPGLSAESRLCLKVASEYLGALADDATALAHEALDGRTSRLNAEIRHLNSHMLEISSQN